MPRTLLYSERALNHDDGVTIASRLADIASRIAASADLAEYASLSAFPSTGSTGKIYLADDTGKMYRWNGSAYVNLSEPLTFDNAPTAGSSNPVKSSGIKTALDNQKYFYKDSDGFGCINYDLF